ncbi:hypothetical protein Tco_1296035 [Tanacetum coccineum]
MIKELHLSIEIYQRLTKKYEISDSSLVKTPIVPPNNLGPYLSGKPVNETLYRGMVGSLMYLNASWLDIQFSTCLLAISSVEAEYVAAARCCANILWMKIQVSDYDIQYKKVQDLIIEAVEFLNNNYGLEEVQALLEVNVKTPILKTWFPMVWRLLMTFVILVLGGYKSSTNQLNSIQQMIVYNLLTRTKIDIEETIFNDLVTKLTDTPRKSYMAYPRFISYVLERLLGTNYAQDDALESTSLV